MLAICLKSALLLIHAVFNNLGLSTPFLLFALWCKPKKKDELGKEGGPASLPRGQAGLLLHEPHLLVSFDSSKGKGFLNLVEFISPYSAAHFMGQCRNTAALRGRQSLSRRGPRWAANTDVMTGQSCAHPKTALGGEPSLIPRRLLAPGSDVPHINGWAVSWHGQVR